jgi:hypothetical protein
MRQRKARQKQRQDDENQNLIKNHRKQAPKHVVTFEIDAPPDIISELLRINRTIAYIGRRVSATARKRLNNLHRRTTSKRNTPASKNNWRTNPTTQNSNTNEKTLAQQ